MAEKINWRIYERDSLYPQNISAYLDLIKFSPDKKQYIANFYEVMTFFKGYFWWARDADLLEDSFRKWFSVWISDLRKRDELFRRFNDSYKDVSKTMPRLGRIELAKVLDKELLSVFETAKRVFLDSISFSEYTVDCFDDFFDKIFAEKLQQLTNNKFGEHDLALIAQPAYVSKSLAYKRALLEMSLKKGKYDPSRLADRFSWVVMSWDGSNELDKDKVLDELNGFLKLPSRERIKQLALINNVIKEVASKRDRILKKHGISELEIKPFFILLDKFSLFHDIRKETQMRCNQVILRCLAEMAERYNVGYKDLLFYTHDQIRDLCLKRIRPGPNAIKKRISGLTYVIRKGKVSTFTGIESKEVLDKLVLNRLKADQTDSVRGIPACHGIVTGTAFVTKSTKEANKSLQPGDVLVTSMTTIDYIPAMKRAGAIVTEDGGMLCHAAIVSRELGIPCIVGTKIATKILKSGMKVEVDANKGIVKILKG